MGFLVIKAVFSAKQADFTLQSGRLAGLEVVSIWHELVRKYTSHSDVMACTDYQAISSCIQLYDVNKYDRYVSDKYHPLRVASFSLASARQYASDAARNYGWQ